MMKTKELILATMLLFLAGGFFSCQKADEILEDDPEEDYPEDFISEITMTAKATTLDTKYRPYGFFNFSLIGSGTATIDDWGDGTPTETKSISAYDQNFDDFRHTYSDPSVVYTIKMTGEKIRQIIVVGAYGYEDDNITYNGYITNLDVSKAKDLINIESCYNPLTSLDLSNNTELHEFHCMYGNLKNLDISKNIFLWWLECSNNQLTSLDVSKNTRLAYLNCSSNKLSAGALNALFEMLPAVSKGIDVNLYIKNNQ